MAIGEAKEYRTRDIYRAVWLEANGHTCRRVESLKPGVGVFVFALDGGVERALDQYDTPEAACNVHDYINAFKRVKSRLFEVISR